MNFPLLAAGAPALRLALLAFACAVSGAASADCTPRPPRPAEAAFYGRALSALVAALPPVPAGVQGSDAQPHDFGKPPAVRDLLCDFSKEGDFSVAARRQYVKKHSEAERRQLQARYDALTAQFHALQKTPPEQVARQEALRRKSNEAWQAARDAEKAGDKPGAEARDAEYRALRDQANAIDTQHQAGVRSETAALDRQRTAIDLVAQRVEVRIGMNVPRLPPAGIDERRGTYGAASPARSAGLTVHNVVYAVDGTDGPLRQALAAALDRARLQAMVGKPLPDPAESAALAARAVAPTVPELVVATAGTPGNDPAAAIASAGPAPTPTSMPTTTSTTTTTTTTTTTAAPAAPATRGDEPLKKAADAVGKLRGLLGR